MKTTITFFNGNKGGVGKSFLTNGYADILMNSQKKDIVIVDTDTENPDVARMWKNHTKTEKIDLSKEEGWMDLADVVEQNQGKEIIISLPAQVGKWLKTNMSSFREMLKEMGIDIKINMFFAMGLTIDSTQLAKRAYEELFENLDNFDVVLNGAFGEKEDFLAWKESKIRSEILKAGGREIYAPALIARTVSKIFHTLNAARTIEPFSARINNMDLGITGSEKMSIRMWLRNVEKAFLGNGE
jgi:hypothetical protein